MAFRKRFRRFKRNKLAGKTTRKKIKAVARAVVKLKHQAIQHKVYDLAILKQNLAFWPSPTQLDIFQPVNFTNSTGINTVGYSAYTKRLQMRYDIWLAEYNTVQPNPVGTSTSTSVTNFWNASPTEIYVRVMILFVREALDVNLGSTTGVALGDVLHYTSDDDMAILSPHKYATQQNKGPIKILYDQVHTLNQYKPNINVSHHMRLGQTCTFRNNAGLLQHERGQFQLWYWMSSKNQGGATPSDPIVKFAGHLRTYFNAPI